MKNLCSCNIVPVPAVHAVCIRYNLFLRYNDAYADDGVLLARTAARANDYTLYELFIYVFRLNVFYVPTNFRRHARVLPRDV